MSAAQCEIPSMFTSTHSDLVRSGLSPHEIATLRTKGQLHRLRRGVYTDAPEVDADDEHRKLIVATRHVVDPTNVLSHTSAALTHGLPIRRDAYERVTMIRRTKGHGDKGPHLLIRNTRITDAEVETRDAFPITTLCRTVADVARTEPRMWGVAAADAALRLGADRAELVDAVNRHARLHGIQKARRVVEFATPHSESPAESVSRLHMQLSGLPLPQQQVEVIDDHGEFVGRVDFLWPEYGLIGEVDGKSKYGTLLRPGQSAEDVVMAEKRRDNALRALGYWIVHWDWSVAIHPGRLRSVVAAGLAAAPGPVRRGHVVLSGRAA